MILAAAAYFTCAAAIAAVLGRMFREPPPEQPVCPDTADELIASWRVRS